MKAQNNSWLKEIFGQQHSQSLIRKINTFERPDRSENPVASIIIPCYNEEKNVLRCILSLLMQKVAIEYEIIVVDNNSRDNSWEYLSQCQPIRRFRCFEQGVEHARQTGLEKARGKYYFSVDADSIYPPTWLQCMHHELILNDGVSCVYSSFSYLPGPQANRQSLALFELLRGVARFARKFNRPYLNCRGLSMGFATKHAREIGFKAPYRGRGEDGYMALGLAKLGEVKNISSTHTKVWTDPGFLSDRSIQDAIFGYCKTELARSRGYFFKKFAPKARI